jgi:hypothetical protein
MDAENQAVKSQDTAPDVKEQATTTVQEETNTQNFSQDDLERIVGERVARERAKYDKKYKGIDVDHYNKLVEAEEKARQTELEKRGEFEKLLKEQAEKFSTKINQYQSELTSIKIDGQLLSEASNAKAINPTQVTQLLKGQLKLNEAGTVDVIDTKTGQVRYNDKGDPIQVKDLVNEFLSSNPHFVSAGPQGSGTGKGDATKESLANDDINNLNMNIPEHRARYREIMRSRGVSV